MRSAGHVHDQPAASERRCRTAGRLAVRHYRFYVTALSANSGNEERQLRCRGADGGKLRGRRRADDEAHRRSVHCPFRDAPSNVEVQRLAILRSQVLELAGTGIRGTAEHVDETVGALQQRRYRLAAKVRTGRDRVRAK